MKKTIFIFFAAISVLVCSCKKTDPFADRSVSFDSFVFTVENNPDLPYDIVCKIDGNKVSATVPSYMDSEALDTLRASFKTVDPEAIVKVGEIEQISGETMNEFSAPVDYIISVGPKNAQVTVTLSYPPATAQWSSANEINIKAGSLALAIDPKSKNPVLAVVENVNSSRGPLKLYNGLDSAPVVVTPSTKENNQYVALGINENGKVFAFTQDYSSKKGNVYTSTDYSTWKDAGIAIEQTNAYYSSIGTIGCIGDEAFVLTCNNANGSVSKRALNTTYYNGTAWNTGLSTFVSETYTNRYFPVMRTSGHVLYAFITNVSAGFSIYKYENNEWSEFITVSASEEYEKFGYGINKSQDMAIAPNGDIYLAIGTQKPLGAAVIKINAGTKGITQVGSTFPLTNSLSARYARIAISPEGTPFLAFRDDNECLMVTDLNGESLEWNTPAKLTSAAADDVEILFNADGDGFIVCSTADHVEYFTLVK